MSLKNIPIKSNSERIILIAVGLVCLIIFFFFGKWFLANAITTQESVKEISELAIDLAPNDPQTHLSLGVLAEKSLLPDDYAKSVPSFEQAVSLSPNNYLFWLALGKARERNGDSEGAEKALRKALELAPNYSQVQWSLGNVLLRQGKSDEAFNQIRQAVAGDSNYSTPAATTAWQFFNGDIPSISNKIGDSSGVKSALAIFLAKQERYTEAMSFWNNLPKEEKKTTYKKNADELFAALITAKKYLSALQVQTEISTSEELIKAETITNASFENDVKPVGAGNFEWQIGDGNQPQFGFDDKQKQSGNRSLVLVFNNAQEFRPFSQIIAVESSKSFRFKGFVSAELKGSATAKFEIVEPNSGKILASTLAIPTISKDWQEISANFTIPENVEGIIIRLVKTPCNGANCQISGKIWLDNFSLEKS